MAIEFNLASLSTWRTIPVVILTKSDLCTNLQDKLAQISNVAIGVDVLVTSAMTFDGINSIKPYIKPGETVTFIGFSGVGKSTLINRLAGKDILQTNITRKDDKGRHTTARRELVLLENGGILIDTPGMRELGVESINSAKAFADIDNLAEQCKFRNCSHQNEPECAVQAAIQNGELTKQRLESYLKLKKEAKYDGLSSKQIEAEKLNDMFSDIGGIKNFKKITKNKNRKK